MKTIPIKTIPNNENSSLCITCKGECCKGSPGAFHPSQLLDENSMDPDEDIKTLLQTGLYSIIFSGERVPTITPATRGHSVFRYFGDTFGKCVHLSNQGCRLTFEARPLECQTLIPEMNSIGALKCHQPEGWDRDEQVRDPWDVYEHHLAAIRSDWEFMDLCRLDAPQKQRDYIARAPHASIALIVE